jgi:DNA polymerase III subunit alpha
LSFVHLHVHSEYSLLESTCELDQIAGLAKDMGMPAVALTDYGNMFGAIEFYFAAKKKGVKPILGLEVYIAPRGRKVKGEDPEAQRLPNRRLVLLAMNKEGYHNLCKISTIGYQEGFYYRPRVDDEVLKEYSAGVIALTGSLMGDVPWTLINQGEEKALERLTFLKSVYGDRLYLEVCRTGLPAWQAVEQFYRSVAPKLDLKVVAANDVHFARSEDQVAQEVLICIGSNKTLNDPSRYRLGTDQFYFRSPDEMRALFADWPEPCDETLRLAERCDVKFDLVDAHGKPVYHLPTFPTQNGRTVEEEIRSLALSGLEKRFREAEARSEAVSEEKKPTYFERLDYELNVIHGMGFNGYFLIVQDFINWAKNNGIPVGPGRGSGAGSLVAFSLGITDLDPLPYHLIFERFLNPERISMPDFDVDFCQDGRGRVIEYVTNKYGASSVSQIITYGKLQARAAIRDVGRVMGMTFQDVDVVSKLMPDKLGITLKEAIETEPRLRDLMEDDPKIATLMDLAQKIEGLTRHAGIHAAGVVIADDDLVRHAPLYRGQDGENVIQYDMKHAEKIGLIKFDFLGLKTLTHINEALALVRRNRGVNLESSQISIKDPGIYEIMSRGDTAGIFQFEGEGITDLIRKAKPNCFEDIVAINALYRPGPMDMIPDYVDRKSGAKKVQYLFPELEDVLKETYGIVVYQEQVQLIAARIASYSLGEADVLRRAMGKKIAEEMAQQKTRFLKGAESNGFDAKKSEELFDTMAKFAEYGFNKSHAAAYCVVAAQTAYIKHYYPVEFYAALLSTEMGDTDKVVKYVKDARRHNIVVRPPSINGSEFKFSVRGEEIFFSLGAIKGVGEAAVNAILEARAASEGQTFHTLQDFFATIDLRRVNKKTIECLIKAGAMDGFGYNRAELLSGYGQFIERADHKRRDQDLGQVSLFALSEDTVAEEHVALERKDEFSRGVRLALEKEVLGFYLGGHPLDGIDTLVKPMTSGSVVDLGRFESKSKVTVLGLASEIKEIITKKGTRMAFSNLEDATGGLELVVFPDTFAQYEGVLKSGGPILVHGVLETDEGRSKILVDKIQRAEDLFKQAKRLTLKLGEEHTSKLALLKTLIDAHPGAVSCTLQVHLSDPERDVEFSLKEPRGISPTAEFFEKISSVIEGPEWRLQ